MQPASAIPRLRRCVSISGRAVLIVAVSAVVLLVPASNPTALRLSVLSIVPDQHVQTSLVDYAHSNAGWTGGDSTWSIQAGDGSEVLAFSDTFLRPTTPPTRPVTAPFVHNSFLVRGAAGRWRTVTGQVAGRPDAVFRSADAESWFWVGQPFATSDGPTLSVPLTRWRSTGSSSLDVVSAGTALGTVDLDHPDRAPAVRSWFDDAPGIQWGQWTSRVDGRLYVYGTGTRSQRRPLVVARFAGPDADGRPEYFDGSGWSADPARARVVADDVSSEVSVTELRPGVWMLISMGSSTVADNRIVARLAPGPVGPFGPAVTVYRTPEAGADGTYHDADIYTYNAHVHPELSQGSRVVVSYNVNSFDSSVGGDLYRDETVYRPRFITAQVRVGGRP